MGYKSFSIIYFIIKDFIQTLNVLQKKTEDQDLKIKKLEAELESYKNRISLNSRNSSKPPSSDGYKKPEPKSLRGSTNQKSGGQAGHKGHTRCQSDNPHTVQMDDPKTCSNCGLSLDDQAILGIEKRQIHDLLPFLMFIMEYQVSIKQCTCGCINKGSFPENIKSPVQYGPQIKALNTYLNQYHLVPYRRTAEIMNDVFQINLSQGTIRNHLNQFDEIAKPFEQKVFAKILDSPYIHFDETGINVNKELHWLHVASTEKLTYYHLDKRRGKIGMDNMNILPNYKGTAIHDHLKSYFEYFCKHSLCNAHHLRELTFIFEQYFHQNWAKKMMDFLVSVKNIKDLVLLSGRTAFSLSELKKFIKQYDKILLDAIKEIPTPNYPSKRGRKKQHKAKNLWDRLIGYKKCVLAFIVDFKIPFDNNQGERDLRMTKTKQKISGCFRSLVGGEQFCRARGFISTARKNKLNPLVALHDAFEGLLPVIP